MPLYSRSDFAKLCGKSRGYITQYVTRRKLIMSGDFIDTGEQQNFDMMNKWLAQKAEKEESEAPDIQQPSKQSPNKSVSDPEPPPPPRVPNTTQRVDPDFTISALDRKKSEADLELKESKIRLSKLQEAKLRGDNIPTSMVRSVVSLLGQSFQGSYKNGAQKLLLDLAHEMKMTQEQEAKYKGKLTKLINESHANAIKEAKIGIKNIVDEVSTIELNDNDE